MMLMPRNWSDFQHYYNRSPPWIKLHKSLLNDRVYMRLPLASKALAPLLWLLASESRSKNGEFDGSTEELEFRLHLSAKEVETGLQPLIDKGFFTVAGKVLAECLQDATPEESREEKETDALAAPATGKKAEDEFNLFYEKYPKKVARPAALKAFKAAKVNGHLPELLADIDRRLSTSVWKLDQKQFIPNPASYLNGRRWEDESGTDAPDTPFEGAR
jgi:hypothetical protein